MNEFRTSGKTGGQAGGRTGGGPADGRTGGPLDDLPWAPAANFLGLPPEHSRFDDSEVLILPVPYEATVSYMGGTRFGPRGLLHASRFVELYDHELDSEPYRIGIHTLPELLLSGAGPEAAMKELRTAFDLLLDAGKFMIMVGGEHSITPDPVLAHAGRVLGRKLSVLQLDAHADLRTEYEGTPCSHACAMHRIHDRVHLVPVGVRSLTSDETRLIRDRKIPVVWGYEIEKPGWIDRVVAALSDDVYITIDVDYFDPAIMPSTGTPEPGGGSWYPALDLLQRVFTERNVVGCDIVELAPLPGLVHPDFLAAKLLYKLIGFHALHGSKD